MLSHSMGAILSLMYASMFPDEVERLILIDTIGDFVYSVVEVLLKMSENINKLLEREKQDVKRKTLTYDQCIRAIIDGHSKYGTIDENGAKYLARRAIIPSCEDEGRYIFTRDWRLSHIVFQGFPVEILKKMYSYIIAERLIIMGNRSLFVAKSQSESTQDILQVHKRSKNFQYIEVDGDHFLHLTNPIMVANIVESYINNSKTGLASNL